MKDITIRITGKQCFENSEEDQMEFITDGRLYEKNGFFYYEPLVIPESQVACPEEFTLVVRLGNPH